MTRWQDDVGAALGRALDRASAPGVREHLATPLLQAARSARGGEAQQSAVVLALLTAGHYANELAAQNLVDGELLARLAAAYSAALDRPDRDRLLVTAAARPPGAVTRLVTSRGLPTLKHVERDLFAWPPAAPPTAPLLAPVEADDDRDPEPIRPSHDEDELYFPRALPPPVRLSDEDERGGPIPVARFYAQVAEGCLEALGTLARQRHHRALGDQADTESSILQQADAVIATGSRCVEHILGWWRASLESRDPWKSWAPAFVLGTLAGADALDAVAWGLEELPLSAEKHGLSVSDALAVSPHPDLLTLGRDLLASPHPISRAVGVDVLARLNAFSPDDWKRHQSETSPPVLAALARSTRHLDEDEAETEDVIPMLLRMLAFPDGSVAWEAARALLRLGRSEPYDSLVQGGRFAVTLGTERALEIFVLRGQATDAARVTSLVSRTPVSPEILSALVRFGHPGCWAFLLHHLANPDIADEAADALEALFGPLVAAEERESVGAWKSAITAMRLDKGVRYRGGAPWRATALVDECASGNLSRREVEQRVDEIDIRLRRRSRLDFSRWWSGLRPSLDEQLTRAAKADHGEPGRWT